MNDDTPQSLKTAAIIQLVSGLVNLFMPAVAGFGWTMFAAACSPFTCGASNLLGLCTFGACLLWPLSIAEILGGALTLANPRQGAPILKVVSILEMASIVCSGFVSCIAGFVVYRMVSEPDVAGYLES